jgi:hypothetical protein
LLLLPLLPLSCLAMLTSTGGGDFAMSELDWKQAVYDAPGESDVGMCATKGPW